jgi:hypothetical protein
MIKRYSRAVVRDIWEEQNKLGKGRQPAHSLMLSPTNFGPICQGETNTFVATTTVLGHSFAWDPATPGQIINAADGLSSTNLHPFDTFGTNLTMTATYGPCTLVATGVVVAVTNVVPNQTNICANCACSVTFTAQASAPGTFPCTPTWTFTPTNAGMLSTTQGVSTAFTPTNTFRGQVLLTAHAGTSVSTATGNVYEVDSVVWEQVVNPLSANPNPGRGQRIFPERTSATAATSDSNRMVRVKATLSPAISNVTVNFRPIDVDDPWTNAAPIDAEPAADNHSDVALTTFTATTDANGVASNVFLLSAQPGNNYRIVASCDPNFPGQFSVVAPSANGALTNATLGIGIVETNFVTPMLTVWRSVHIEKDSMSGPGSNNFVTGGIPTIQGVVLRGATQVVLNVNLSTGLGDSSRNLDTPGTNVANGRFENGFIDIGTTPVRTAPLLGNENTRVTLSNLPGPAATNFFNLPFVIFKGAATNTGQIVRLNPGMPSIFRANTVLLPPGAFDGGTLVVAGQSFGVSNTLGQQIVLTNNNATLNFVLHDDDDDTLLPKFPDTSLLAGALQEAYVEPKFNTTGVADNNNLNAVPFDANLDTLKHAIIVVTNANTWQSRDLNANDFWVAYVLNAYQWETPFDRDPTSEQSPPLGIKLGATLERMDGSSVGGSLIFLETIREVLPISPFEEQNVVIHEVGHAVSGKNIEPVTECEVAPPCATTNIHYRPIYLDFIRDSPKPGSPP